MNRKLVDGLVTAPIDPPTDGISRPIAFLASSVTAGRKLTRVLVDLGALFPGQGTAQVGRCARCGPTSCGERECERVNLAGAG